MNPDPLKAAMAKAKKSQSEAEPTGLISDFDPNPNPYMLSLEKQDGTHQAFGYPYLVKIHFNPSQGIVITFTEAKVTLEGRNLAPIYNGLVNHTIKTLQEVHEEYDELPEDEIVINQIIIEEN